ncbi:MAG: hypothetical protein QNJ63_08550 [Calothrix sp. MO_192.B10]|nr:hypothetical protein [Calothrix sp. MO_192.B10]
MNKKELKPLFSEISTQESAAINGGNNSISYGLSPEAITKLRSVLKIGRVIIRPIIPVQPPDWRFNRLFRYLLANKK